jgi:N-acetyl-anhydromuramyl-L-alanine amidase AmpD
MPKHRTRVGLHARNDKFFTGHDYELVRLTRVETLKMMSHTDVSVFEKLRKENPQVEFIVRLYDDRINNNSRPTPAQFVARMVPIMRSLRPYANKYEIHNEPNHVSGIEGWGASDSDARAFNSWYLQVLSRLRRACPWASLGFPGLALNSPHRDLNWLSICKSAIEASDWLGCHCYWQYDNMLSDAWGLRFKLYHQRFPDKKIEITEFGNSTPDLSREEMAAQYAQYYQHVNSFPYLGSASSFIASSPDPAWIPFVWMKEGGDMLPVVHQVRHMERKPAEVPVWPSESQKPSPSPTERTFPQTGKTVRGRFLKFFDNHGLDICGYPVTDQIVEDGLQTQYFQRVALEELESGQIRLKPVGKEAWDSRRTIASQEARLRELSQLLFAVGPDAPPIEDIVDDLPTHPTKRYPTRPLSAIRSIVIHHTATASNITPERVANYQVTRRGMPGIGHHFYVAANGTIYQTNRLETESDHAFHRNRSSIGICFPGNFTKSIPKPAQLDAGAKLCAWLLGVLGLSTTAIVGVGEFADTQSPGVQWLSGERWKNTLLQKVRSSLKASGAEYTALIASLQGQIRSLQLSGAGPGHQPAPASIEPSSSQNQIRVSEPPIQDLIDSLPKHDTEVYETRPIEDIRYLVIHHSAAPSIIGPKTIAAYHIRKHDWPGIGYHYVVAENGTLYQTNALETKSYHAVKANPYGVGICFLGNFTNATPPPAQIQAGAHLVAWLMGELNLPIDSIKGHKDLMGTACPGRQWLEEQKWKATLYSKVREVQREKALPSPPEPAEPKPIYHYLLFWARGEEWAVRDWLNAINYIGVFRPTVGFSAEDAAQAQYVTIVGGTSGVSQEVESQLKAAGCQVERIVGRDDAEMKRILDQMAQQGRRFLSFQEQSTRGS